MLIYAVGFVALIPLYINCNWVLQSIISDWFYYDNNYRITLALLQIVGGISL
jgi:hypothetical protein